jgi:NADH:ubiquinone oxidoreductase subunit 2 (subunit N)
MWVSSNFIFLGLILCYFIFGIVYYTEFFKIKRNNDIFTIISLNIAFTQLILILNEIKTYSFVEDIGIFTLYFKVLILMSLIVYIFMSIFYLKAANLPIFEFHFLIMISVWAMLILISATDLFVIFLVIELQNLCFYILISLKRFSNLATEAAFKYLIINGFSASVLGIGLSLIYSFFGTLNIIDLMLLVAFDYELMCIIGIFFIFIGIFFKLAIFPFHY